MSQRLGVLFETALHCGPLAASGHPDLAIEAPERSTGGLIVLLAWYDVIVFANGHVAGGEHAMKAWTVLQALRYFAPLRDPNEGDLLATDYCRRLTFEARRPFRLDSVLETPTEIWELAQSMKIADDLGAHESGAATQWAKRIAALVDRETPAPSATRPPEPAGDRVQIAAHPS